MKVETYHHNKELQIKLDLNRYKALICQKIRDLRKKWKFKKPIFSWEMQIYVSYKYYL